MTLPVAFGRRDSDKWLAQLLGEVLGAVKQRPQASILTTISPKTGRRPRRTKRQLKEALKRATEQVSQAFPAWTHQRVLRRARVLVKTYQVV